MTTIFISKLAVIVGLMFLFFVLFNVGVYLSALIPYLVVSGVSYPDAPIPYAHFLNENLKYFIDCLPIVALQYLISLQYRNFLVPVGIGFIIWIGAIASLTWQYGYFIPYTYCMYTYLMSGVMNKAVATYLQYPGTGAWLFCRRDDHKLSPFLFKKETG